MIEVSKIIESLSQNYLDFLKLLIGIVLLIKGADILIDACISLAKHYKISGFIIGLLVLAVGTSLPELVVSVFLSLQGNSSELLLANIVGSNNSNIMFILGCTLMVSNITLNKHFLTRLLPENFIYTLLFLLLFFFIASGAGYQITQLEGIFFLLVTVLHFYKVLRKPPAPAALGTADTKQSIDKKEASSNISINKVILFAVISCIMVGLGGKWVSSGAKTLAVEVFQVRESFVGIFIVSISTSLPELVTSVKAAQRNQSDLLLGSLVGSNFFNMYAIGGISAVLSPIVVELNLGIDILWNILALILIFFLAKFNSAHILKKSYSLIFIGLFAFYLFYVFQRSFNF